MKALITEILSEYKSILGADFDSYHHHCQRVYIYSKTLLLVRENKKLAIAAAFHDLDIWTGQTMNYLNGSSEMCLRYLLENKLFFLPDEMKHIIEHHHQLTAIKGNIEAESFRKADLIDLSAGLIRYNLPKSFIQNIEEEFPRLEFSKMILRKVVRYGVKHPTKPFPMIKW